MADIPAKVVWAWERPEDLSFVDPEVVGVAYLAQTIVLRGDEVRVKPRIQPLTVPDKTKLIAVTRIESDQNRKPTLSAAQRAGAVSSIIKAGQDANISALQIDFDAKLSERAFYRDLLIELRNKIPGSQGLSITALASWCTYDDWLSTIPIDEAVPMLFRMGADRQSVLLGLQSGDDFSINVCRTSYGLSTDEQVPNLRAGRRQYFFNPQRWTQTNWPDLTQENISWSK